jgi:hypothetical protein
MFSIKNAALTALVLVWGLTLPAGVEERPEGTWVSEFPNTDFSKTNIKFGEIVTDGPKRDQIPPIHKPKFIAAAEDKDLGPNEPVLSLSIKGDARAYPLRILLWHEIVNDLVGGVPVLVSYCPLCNSDVVFDRRIGGQTLRFGNTGRIRHFDMVMYDLETESWWQQFLGSAIISKLTEREMKLVPARLESFARFKARASKGRLLIPDDANARPYGATPYVGMGRSQPAVFRRYPLPSGLGVTDRVVVGDHAWPLKLLRAKGTLTRGDLTLSWVPGQNSIHDTQRIANGRDVGNVLARRRTDRGSEEVPYDVTFAFVFSAFRPKGQFHTK